MKLAVVTNNSRCHAVTVTEIFIGLIGIEKASTSPSHTTEHTGHVSGGSLTLRFLMLPGLRQLGQPHLTKQFCGRCQAQGWCLAQAPWPMRAFACVPSLAHSDPAFPEFAVARAAPLFPCVAS